MSKIKFILKSFWFYRRHHLAVLAGIMISTAVLTGALITGDSIRFSLRKMVDARLGKTEYILSGGDRIFRAELAKDLATSSHTETAPLLVLQAIASNPENENRIGKTQVVGIDSSFWRFCATSMQTPKEDEAIISDNTAQKLGLAIGDDLVLRVENKGPVPINSPFSKEESPSVSFRLKVVGIADENSLGRFNLKNNQVAPFNIFLNIDQLCKSLDIEGLSNLILVNTNGDSEITQEKLDEQLEEVWLLKDAGLNLASLGQKDEIEITSSRIFIDEQIASSIIEEYPAAKRILTYLVNSLKHNGKSTPYSFVAAVSEIKDELSENEIVINEWLADDLDASPGDTISLDYYSIGQLQTLKEETADFIVKKVVPTEDSLFDRSLMPRFPGIEESGNCSDWNANIPIDLDRIRDKDEDYWDNHKGTPKAVISMQSAQVRWGNKYGRYTAIRIAESEFENANPEKSFRKSFFPRDLNFRFFAVQKEAIRAAGSGVDFGELFLSLSFFVIVAGVLLSVMIYALNLETRKQEAGLLAGLGFTNAQILKIRIGENIITAVIGSFVGIFAGLFYNWAIMEAINSVWNDIIRTSMLEVFINPETLGIGALSGFLIALVSIWLVTRRKLKEVIAGLLNNNTQTIPIKVNNGRLLNILLSVIGIFGAFATVVYSVITSVDKNAGLFLMAGGLFLLGTGAIASLILKRKTSPKNPTVAGFMKMAISNAGRNRNRSMAALILVSLGTFVVLITGANRETFSGSENRPQSGTGGYAFWATSSLPIPNDLNSEYGKSKLGLTGEENMKQATFFQMHTLDGEDASCLNLNQVQNPSLIGVNTEVLSHRQAFSFSSLHESINSNDPWKELDKTLEGGLIPAFADQSVITWGLKKKLGDTLTYFNEAGEKISLMLAGGLNNSVFQGNILVSQTHFSKQYPSADGSKLMLIDVPQGDKAALAEFLKGRLQDFGFETDDTVERLRRYYSITNTYMSVFMILGGLGVIIGTFGLGIVVFRNMLDRRQEIALFTALGFSRQKLFKLLFAEYLAIITYGTASGVAAALIGIMPSFLSQSFNIPGTFVFLLVILIFVNALVWVWFPLKNALNKNLVLSLRKE